MQVEVYTTDVHPFGTQYLGCCGGIEVVCQYSDHVIHRFSLYNLNSLAIILYFAQITQVIILYIISTINHAHHMFRGIYTCS